MRINVRSRLPWRIASNAAAEGIRWVKPSKATLSPSWIRCRTASARLVISAMFRLLGPCFDSIHQSCRGFGLFLSRARPLRPVLCDASFAPILSQKKAKRRWEAAMGKLAQSYVHGTSDRPLIGDTIGVHLDRMASLSPDRPALIARAQKVRWSYGEFQSQVDATAAGLVAMGFLPGDRIGIWSPNNAEWVVTQFATAKAGAILVNINPAYRLHELEYALNKAGCAGLILAPSFKTSDYLAMIVNLCPEIVDAATPESRKRLAALQGELQFDDPINIQFTSGTTDNPKGATLTHHNILNNGFFIGEAMRLTERDKLCIPVPLYHCFGMVLGNLACITHASCMVIPSEGFDPLAVLQTVQEERCTALHGVPTMFIAVLDHPEFRKFELTSLRTGIMAGSPCPIEVMKRVVS